MKLFSRLKIFHKILAILIVGFLAFIINLTLNISAISKNQKLLEEIKNETIHLANYTSENNFLFKQLDETYSQSVTFSDEDLVNEDANNLAVTLFDNLKKVKQLSKDSNIDDLVSNITEYKKLSDTIALSMISGEADFSAIQSQAKVKGDLFKTISAQILEQKKAASTQFEETIEATVENSNTSERLSIIIGGTLLLIMAVLGFIIAKLISQSVQSVESSLKELAEGDGDLTKTLSVNSEDELGSVVNYFNGFTSMLRGIVQEVVDVVNPLMSSAEQLSTKVTEVKTNVEKQSEVAEITKHSMTEMQFSVADIAKSAAEAAQAATSGEQEVEQGMTNVSRSVAVSGELNQEISNAAQVVDQLASDSQNMNQILDVINGIAEQTNLLALNAAIEAARAGEQGRGFAVVADEVRNLASRTALSTTEIRELLDKLILAASQSVQTMEKAKEKANSNQEISNSVGESLNTIKEQIGHISSMNTQIATATEEQSSVAETVLQNIEEMYQSFNVTSLVIEDIGGVANTLDTNASQIEHATAKFVI